MLSFLCIVAAVGCSRTNVPPSQSDVAPTTAPAAAAPVTASLAAASPAATAPDSSPTTQPNISGAPGDGVLTAADNAFLDDLEQRSIRFFVDEADPATGLMPDKSDADGGKDAPASIASVGFGLTALCIADSHGWISRREAYDRSLRVIQFLHDQVPTVHGFYYHFLDMHTGVRAWNCEVSTIDTSLLIAGVLTSRAHFPGTALASLADDLYERIDWPSMVAPDGSLSMGWKPDAGLLSAEWSHFNEGWLVYLLAMGSQKHPLDPDAWNKWDRASAVITYAGATYMQHPPLFIQQYPQCWFDVRGQRDDYVNFYRNSQLATVAQRTWCMNELSLRWPTYGPQMWGLTASECERGYAAWGGPPAKGPIDGSVVPAAAGGSLAFEPRLCLDALESMKQQFGDRIYKKYGFVDAFNPSGAWTSNRVLGIDVGPMLIAAENCRSAFVWTTFMQNPEAKAALVTAHFRPIVASDPPTQDTSMYR